jgi:hypothetical protein
MRFNFRFHLNKFQAKTQGIINKTVDATSLKASEDFGEAFAKSPVSLTSDYLGTNRKVLFNSGKNIFTNNWLIINDEGN